MKIRLLFFLTIVSILVGCVNEGKGNASPAANGEGNLNVIKPNPYEGPAGGGNLEKSWPVLPASSAPDGNTSSAFPSTVPPGQ